MPANLSITQNAVSNTPGQSHFIDIGDVVTLGNEDDTGATAWVYELLSVPRTSALVPGILSSGPSATTTFTPDVAGSYRIKLTVVKDGRATIQTRLAIVKTSRGWILPPPRVGAEELNYPDPVIANYLGWSPALEDIFRDMNDLVGDGVTLADDIARSAGTDIDRVRGLRGIPISGSDAAAPPIGGTQVYNAVGTASYKQKKPVMPGHFDVQDYGAVADYNPGTGTGTDNLAAFTACLAAMKAANANGVTKMVVDGYYYLSNTLHIRQGVHIQGSGMSEPTSGSGAQRSGPGTWLVWPTNVDGIVFEDQGDVLGGADGSTIADLNVYCSYQGRTGVYGFPYPADGHTGNGVVVTGQNIKLLRVNVQNFAENGFLITAGNNSTYDVAANAGGFRLDGCISGANGGCGLKVEGGDATVGNVINCGFTVNHGWGLSENTIGNTYIGIHCEGNRGFRPDIPANYSEYYIRSGVDNNGSVMIGCYAEGTISELDSSVQCIGGSLALKQSQIHQDGSQGLSSSIGSRNAVAGSPLAFENTDGPVTTLVEFGSQAGIGTDGIVFKYATPYNSADYTYLRYNDGNGWWEYDNASVGRPFYRTPTTIARPRWVAPQFPNGYFLGTTEPLASVDGSKVLVSHTLVAASPSASGQTYEIGDFAWNKVATPTGNLGWQCTTAGTMGTLVGVTGSITSGLTALTLDDITDVLKWQYITIAGVSGIKQIVTDPSPGVGTAGVVEIDTAADATVSGAAVAWSAAAFTSFDHSAQTVAGVSGTCEMTAGTLRWDTATASPLLTQADNTTNGATAAVLTVRAQRATGTTSAGGNLNLCTGSGTASNGTLNYRVDSSTVVAHTLNPTGAFIHRCVAGVTAITFDQGTLTSGTGAPVVFKGQNATTGAGSTVTLGGDTGSTEYGQVSVASSINLGRVSQAMADANQTLSVANSAKNIVITTGALTTTRTLTISLSPTSGVMKFFRNNCTGGSVTVQFLTGTGVTIAAGASALIYADGTNAAVLMTGT